MEFDKDKGKVDVYYWQKDWTKDGKKAEIGVIDLLWRFVGFDLRKCAVQCSGDYRSDKNMTRNEKYEAHKEDMEQILRNRTEAMRQEMRDRHATIDGGSSGKVSEILPLADSYVPNIKEVM